VNEKVNGAYIDYNRDVLNVTNNASDAIIKEFV